MARKRVWSPRRTCHRLLDDVLKKSPWRYQQNIESLEKNSEIQALKSKFCDQGKELFRMQEEAGNDKTEGSYDKIKADCLVLVNEIQENVKQSLYR